MTSAAAERPGIVTTDFHCHVLPGADHGSANVATSLRQLQLLRRAGVERLVATPHFYPDKTGVERFLRKRECCLRALLEALPNEPFPTILTGAEVLLVEELDEMEGLSKLCVSGTNVLLLELPLRRLTERLADTVERLTERRDLHIVLAHIERYPAKEINALLELPLQAQVNAPAFLRLFGKKRFLRLLDEGKLVALGSDLHGDDPAASGRFRSACAKLGEKRLTALMAATDALLEGAEIAYCPQ